MTAQALLLARHDLRRDVLVLSPEDEQQAEPAESFGGPREIEPDMRAAAPQRAVAWWASSRTDDLDRGARRIDFHGCTTRLS